MQWSYFSPRMSCSWAISPTCHTSMLFINKVLCTFSVSTLFFLHQTYLCCPKQGASHTPLMLHLPLHLSCHISEEKWREAPCYNSDFGFGELQHFCASMIFMAVLQQIFFFFLQERSLEFILFLAFEGLDCALVPSRQRSTAKGAKEDSAKYKSILSFRCCSIASTSMCWVKSRGKKKKRPQISTIKKALLPLCYSPMLDDAELACWKTVFPDRD